MPLTRLTSKQLDELASSPDVSHVPILIAEVRRLRSAAGEVWDTVIPIDIEELGCNCALTDVLAKMREDVGDTRIRRIIGNIRRANTIRFNKWKKAGYPVPEASE